MIVADLPLDGLRQQLQDGLLLRTGPVVSHIVSPLETVARGIALHYAGHPLEASGSFADFHVRIARPMGWRRWYRPQVHFFFDNEPPFHPLPLPQAFPMLEWGLNWCVSNQCHQYLTLHSAVVERGGRAMLLPAPPGSGKSTLCAGLVNRGWRLLSDELGLIAPDTLQLSALPRPVSLKNQSIDVIKAFAPDAAFNDPVHDTIKGSVAHMRPPLDAVVRADEVAAPGWVVLPRYVPGAPAELRPLSKARALMALIENSFNFPLHGRRGFDVLGDLVAASDCFEFSYGDLEEATQLFARIADGK